MAYDTIMVFEDRFKNHIIPEQVHMLNVSFLVPQLRREFGGCAGNIAYNLRQLGDTALPMSTVGEDFAAYRAWLKSRDVPDDFVRVVPGTHTAQAFITTDLDDNQITAFHPGAMQHAAENRVTDAAAIALGIVAPDGREGMLQHAAQFAAANIPFIFDPGQGLPMFGRTELAQFLEQATWIAVNEYEWQLLQKITQWTQADVLKKVEALIVTRGAQGSSIYTAQQEWQIPAAKVSAVVDPTGCGDAYRAGLLHGLLHGLGWERTGHLAAVLGAIKIETRGTQNHQFTAAEVAQRVSRNFN
jgi:adenosine kinase